jgi:hypothetical protein
MSKYGVQNPITAGQFTAAYNASAVADTDWHTLTSGDFYDWITGQQVPDGYKFAYLGMASGSSSSISYVKGRAADAGSDGKTNTDGVIPVLGAWSNDIQALNNGSQVTSIAYAKGGAGDSVIIYAGFNKV